MREPTALERHLDASGVKYERIDHPRSANAADVAKASHVRARELARVELVRTPAGAPWMLIVPASERLDRDLAARVVGEGPLEPAPAELRRKWFPGCDPSAIAPFGPLHGVPAVLDPCFEELIEHDPDAPIYFEAGDGRALLAMRFEDFRKLAGPFAHEACLHVRPRVERHVKHGGRGALL